MTTFPTPEPISASIQILVGDITVTARDSVETVVAVLPKDPRREADVAAAAEAIVEFAYGVLTVKVVKKWQRYIGPGAKDGAVLVSVEVPTGSALKATTGMGSVRTEGALGAANVKSGLGDIRLDHVASLTAKSGLGDVSVDAADDARVVAGSGAIHLGIVKGACILKCASGNIDVATSERDINVRTASGDITIGRALSSVSAGSAAGDISIAEVSTGSVSARTGTGAIHIGVREGAAAWLDVVSKFGAVRNGLDVSPGPGDAASAVEVRAKTGAGDITIERSRAA